jgi:hypothetical protein
MDHLMKWSILEFPKKIIKIERIGTNGRGILGGHNNFVTHIKLNKLLEIKRNEIMYLYL